MGLFDALQFDPSSFSGQGGGLLDFLKQYASQPGTNIGQPNPQGPNSPDSYVPVGNYQMPMFGASLQSAAGQLPAMSQPVQGQMPQGQPMPGSGPGMQPQQDQQAQPQQQPGLPPALGGGMSNNGFLRGVQSVANGGGLISAITGNYNDPRSVQQQNLKAQYDSLVPMLGPQKAMLAVMNPEAGKTLLSEALTNKADWGVISEDPLQGKQYGWINKLEQTINGKPAGASGSGGDGGGSSSLQQMTDNIAAKVAAGATRPELLQEIPSQYRGYVDSVLSGKALPTNIGRSQIRGSIMTLAHSIDPNFDETMIPQRVKTAQDYAPSGKSGQAITAFNTVQHHIGKLSDDAEKLDNSGWTIFNTLRNGLRSNTPLNPQQQTVIQSVNDDIKAVTDEMSAAYKAGHVSDAEIAGWNKLINSDLPLPRMRQALTDFTDLLNGKRDALNKQHVDIMGRDAPTIDKEENAAITQKVRARNSGQDATASTGAAPQFQEGMTATNPQTGQKLTFRGGKWQ